MHWRNRGHGKLHSGSRWCRTSRLELLSATSDQLMNLLGFDSFARPGVSPLRLWGLRFGLVDGGLLLGLGAVLALQAREESCHDGWQD